MNEWIAEIPDNVKAVISAGVDGGMPNSYCVYSTAERVFLVFGCYHGSHKEAFLKFIADQTDNTWVTDEIIAKKVGAVLAIGRPRVLEKFNQRLIAASVDLPLFGGLT
jgi:hypothetical protein